MTPLLFLLLTLLNSFKILAVGGGTLYVLTFTIATIISSHHDQSSNSNKAGNREIEIKRKIRMVSVREEPMSQTNFSVA